MSMNRFLVAAALAVAIGVPIISFLGEIGVSQPTTSPTLRVSFLHGSSDRKNAGQSELASLSRADAWFYEGRLPGRGRQ